MMNTLFSIGYATKPIETFIAQLQLHSINAVADIRSVPYSKVFADYHQENIAYHLRQAHIRYAYLGDELGPRSKDDAHYNHEGQIQFDRLMQSTLFQQGIKRLEKGIRTDYRIALMCAEKDAATCHRSLLVGYFLHRNPIAPNLELLHINHEGKTETQESLEQRIMDAHDKGCDLFMTEQERRARSYNIQCQITSYKRP